MIWNLLRRARIRGLKEGKVQTGRIEAFGPDARDGVERHQDYGFAANPVDGEGLRIEFGGHTFILRVDRLAERPELGAYEVCVWHKDGHRLTLKDDGVIEANCARFVVNASAEVVFNTPTVTSSGDQVVGGTATADTVVGLTDVMFAGKSSTSHEHGGIERGTEISDPPV